MEVEEIFVSQVTAGGLVRINNPFETESITFLQLWLSVEPPVVGNFSNSFRFDSASLQNNLSEIVPGTQPKSLAGELQSSVSLGRLSGRQEIIYKLKNRAAGILAFVIAGAFEIEGRLLQPKDSLAL